MNYFYCSYYTYYTYYFISVIGQATLDGWQGLNETGMNYLEGGMGMTPGMLQHKSKTDVAAVLAAAAATANFETSESTTKRRKQAAEELKQQEEEIAAAEASSAPMMIGATVTGHALITQNGKQKMKFIPPIYLAPLERRKIRSQKKLVPLIEPDICNYIHIDFLPRTLLRLSGDKLDITMQEITQQLSEQQIDDASAAAAAPDGASEITQTQIQAQDQPAHAAMPVEEGGYVAQPEEHQGLDPQSDGMAGAQVAEY
jgi:hypothetical protein